MEEQIEIIMNLKSDTILKYKVFKKILNYIRSRYLENELSNNFKVEYIRLLAQFKKKKVSLFFFINNFF